MRILSIRFKNLNSLAGEWEIDLTAPPYRVDGIFAITGPTGAGKSTILDALCLALYGRTPRLNTISAINNEILSKHQTECFAEVIFEVEKQGDRRRYRAYWVQHRARKSAEGALQQPRREISDADTGKVLEKNITDVAEFVEEQTGMDFDRFTRSMLLAQGEFTTFLKATPAERAPILEQITGTEIYSEISMKVHERRSIEQGKLNTLRATCEGIRVLSPEETQECSDNLLQKREERDTLTADITALGEKIEWMNRIRTLEGQRQETEGKLRSIREESEAFQPDRFRLERANQTLPLHGGYEVLKTLRAQQREDSNQLEGYRSALTELEEKVREAEREMEERKGANERARDDKEQGMRLIVGVRALDLRIAESDRRINDLDREARRLNVMIQQLTGTRTQKAIESEACSKEGERLDLWFSEHRGDEPLAEHFSAIRQSVEGYKALAASIDPLRERLRQTKARRETAEQRRQNLSERWQDLVGRLNQAQKAESDQAAVLQAKLGGRTLEEMRSQLDRLKTRKNWLERLIDPLRRMISGAERIAEIVSLLIGLDQENEDCEEALGRFVKSKERAEQVSEALKRLIERIRRAHDLESERKKLEDNVPCPLCGALEHPYARENIPTPDPEESELENVNGEIRELTKKIDALRIKIAQNHAKKAHLLAERAEKQTALETDAGRRDELYRHLGIDPREDLHENLAVVNGTLESEAPILEGLSSEISALESVGKLLEEQRRVVQRLKDDVRKAENELNAAVQEESLNKQAYEQAEETYAEKERVYGETRQRLLESLIPYGISEVSPENADTVLEALDSKRRLWNENKRRKETLTTNQARIDTEIENLTITIQTREAEIVEKRAVLERETEAREDLRSSRRELFQDRNTDTEEKRLSDALDSSERALNASRETLSQRLSDRQSMRELKEKSDRSVRERAAEIGNRESNFQTDLISAGFSDEVDFLNACLEEPQRLELSLRDSELRTRESHLQEALRALEQDLHTEKERRLSEEPYETLLSQSTQYEERRQSLQEEIGALQQRLSAHEQAMRERAEQLTAIAAQTRELARWEELHALIGSADGRKYRNFAQGLTFVTMVAYANDQLRKLTDRYLLSCNPDIPLELVVQDLYQAGVSRSAKNLSGGESFLVSLALALGLSQMSSRNARVDSLFLDEGFGTLDEEALETALATLSGLRQEGKLIGVISHVAEIKERLPVQIEVIPLGGGISALKGPGCRRVEGRIA